MVQCWSRDQIYMSYNDTKKKKTIKETLTVGFNHAVADPGEGAPLIFTTNWGPRGRKNFTEQIHIR